MTVTEEKEYKAEIIIGKSDADREEYPKCRHCDHPQVLLAHTDAIGMTMICSNEDCTDGLQAFAKKQIGISTVNKCIEATGLDTLRNQIEEKVEILKEYREEKGLEPVEIPE